MIDLTASTNASGTTPAAATGSGSVEIVGGASAGYKGYQAVAVVLSARVTQSLKVRIGAAVSSATATVSAGTAYQW